MDYVVACPSYVDGYIEYSYLKTLFPHIVWTGDINEAKLLDKFKAELFVNGNYFHYRVHVKSLHEMKLGKNGAVG